MIQVVKATGRSRQRDFLTFPLKLYKGNPCFVPPLMMDERKLFRKDYHYYDDCEAVYYNAYKDGKMAGRISGIIQRAYNRKHSVKRVRFIRFDVIEDFEVAKALFDAVEIWAKERGMDTACGPLNFSDLEREGLLIDGFDQLSTFEEQYNASYYQDYIERLGYVKEVDWLESKITAPDDPEREQEMVQLSSFIMKRYKLHFAKAPNIKAFLRKYAEDFFTVLDKSYEDVYGTVPFTEGMKKLLMSNFSLILDMEHLALVLDENEKPVCLGLCFPSIAKAVQKSGGRLTPGCIIRILKSVKKPDIIDFGLIGVDPEWANRGVSMIIAAELVRMLKAPGLKWAETNLNLEDNYAINNLWNRFGHEQHKRRRSYVKKLI